MLEAAARNSMVRDSFSGMSLVNAMSNTTLPGPIMLLRRASPNSPVGGVTKAAVLNHSARDGFARAHRLPGNQVGPERSVRSAVHVGNVAQQSRSEGQARSDGPIAAPLPVSEDRAHWSVCGEPATVVPEGQFPEIVGGELVRLVETGKPALGGEIKSVLRDGLCATRTHPNRWSKHRRSTWRMCRCPQSKILWTGVCASAPMRRWLPNPRLKFRN